MEDISVAIEARAFSSEERDTILKTLNSLYEYTTSSSEKKGKR